MVDTMREFTGSLPAWLQWLGVMIAGAIPFIESYLAAPIGVVVGVKTPIAIMAAILGNTISMLAAALLADTVQGSNGAHPEQRSPARQRLRRWFEKHGVAGVSLVSNFILPSQVTSVALISFGASRNAVILWHTVSIVLWGITTGTLAAFGVDMLSG